MDLEDGDLVVRVAAPGDCEELVALVKELAEFEQAPEEVALDAKRLAAALFGDPPLAAAHVAELDGAVVGCAIWFRTFSTWTGRAGVHLEDLFVREGARGRGVGRALVRELAAETLRIGGARLEWNVLDWNARAIGFYAGLGASELGAWTTWRLQGSALRVIAAE